jgi:hypothetical protein
MKWENAYLIHNGGKLQRKKARCESEVANEDVAKVIGSNHPQTIMVEHEYVPKNRRESCYSTTL